MNTSSVDEACDFTPTATEAVYKNDVGNTEEETLPAESDLFRILATILVFVAWVYLIVKAYLDYEANRADILDNELRNEIEGDHRLHDLFNNANDLDPDPANAAAVGPGQPAIAAEASASTEVQDNGASAVARRAASSTERRRRQRSSDARNRGTVFHQDDPSPVAAVDDARVAEPVQGAAADIDGKGKSKKQLSHVRKYARIAKPEDSRSKEPETSDEDLVPSHESKPETRELTDESQAKTTTVAIATQNETQQVPSSSMTVVDDNDVDTQSAADVSAVQLDRTEDSQVIPSNPQQSLDNDQKPSNASNTEIHCSKRIAVLNRHGTSFDEGLIAEASARTELIALGAAKRNEWKTSGATQLTSHRIIDCLNARLLEQLAMDLVRRMEEQKISDEILRQEIELQARARYEAQRCYAEVVDQIRWFGLGWESAQRETRQKEEEQEEEEEQGRQSNRESTDHQDTTQDKTTADDDSISGPPDTTP